MAIQEYLGQNPYKVKIPDDIKETVGTPDPKIKLSDHIHTLISQGVLDARGLPVYIKALEVEYQQLADDPKIHDNLRKNYVLYAGLYSKWLNEPEWQGKLCLDEARGFDNEETDSEVMAANFTQNSEFRTKALTAHKAAQNWRNIASAVYPPISLQVKKL